MKLYKQYGINPVGGCLPMMIQIPIFFGLFTMLGQAVELRNAKFLWVKDLSQPDTLFVIPGMGWVPILGIAGVGLAVNILPIVMGATQVWLMRMTPKTGGSNPAPGDDVHASNLLVFLLQFCGSSGIVLHRAKSFQHLAILSEQTNPCQSWKKLRRQGNGNDDDAEGSARYHAGLSRFRCANRGDQE